MSHRRIGTALLVMLLSSTAVFAQAAPAYMPPAARTYAAPAAGALLRGTFKSPAAAIVAFVRARGLAMPGATLVEVSATAARNDITVRRFEERVGGLAVYGVYAKAAFAADGSLIYLIENLVPAPARTAAAARFTEHQALRKTLATLFPGELPPAALVSRLGATSAFERTAFFHEGPTVTRVLIPTVSGLSPAMLVSTWSERDNLLHETLIGAGGDVAFVELRTNHDRYNVFVESPLTGTQTVVEGPARGGVLSPDGWLSAGAQKSIDITGNNVHAYLDVNSNNRADRGGRRITGGEFLAAADLEAAPSTAGNQAVAVQNLFYLNNITHDRLYAHGFTESAGNFQIENFRRGGRGRDPVLAEAQDGGGTDNANFATPRDGLMPRMQMYLWSGLGPDHLVEITAPASAAGTYGARGAEFGSALTTTGLSGSIVLVDDAGGESPTDACEAVQPAVSGKIALADRGTCAFTVKAANAQAAGAMALIVANNTGGTEILLMGGTDETVTIPSVMIGQNDGARLKAATGLTGRVRKNPHPPLDIDGTLDSDIVFHEYGHGLTWRMIGGMSGPLAGAIGEGASDGIAMLFNGDDRIAEYAASNPDGIRRNRYAGYPRTYADVTGAEVHDDGEIYAAIVWRLKENFENAGVRNAVSVLLDDIVDGMNYTPSTPAFEDMRDGIVRAAAPKHRCLVWDAFADFGVGVGAEGVVIDDTTVSITPSFAVPKSCAP